MKTEATPRPWVQEGEHIFDTKKILLVCEMRGWGHLIVKMSAEEVIEVQHANAELIVRAVNHFDELVEALESRVNIRKAELDRFLRELKESNTYGGTIANEINFLESLLTKVKKP